MTLQELRYRANQTDGLYFLTRVVVYVSLFFTFMGGLFTPLSFYEGKIDSPIMFITGVICNALFILCIAVGCVMLNKAKQSKLILVSAIKKYAIKIDIELRSVSQETLYCYYGNYYEGFGMLSIRDLSNKTYIYKEELKSYKINNEMVDISTLHL